MVDVVEVNAPKRKRSRSLGKSWIAHTTIRYSVDGELREVKPGEKVTQAQLGLTDEQWHRYTVIERVIRKEKFPDLRSTESPREHNLRKARKLMEEVQAGNYGGPEDDDDEDEDDGATAS